MNEKTDYIKYSKVSKSMTNRQLKKYYKDNCTLILDQSTYFSKSGEANYTDLKKLIIDSEYLKENKIEISKCGANDIYTSDVDNLGGLTISADLLLNHKIRLYLTWGKIDRALIDKINIVYDDKVVTVDSKKIEKVFIDSTDVQWILIENYNSIVTYIIDKTDNVKKTSLAREINQEDIKDDTLDLRLYDEYNNVYLNEAKFNKLIINKKILKNIDKYRNIINNNDFDVLEIVDDNDMRLFPNNIIPLNKDKIERCYNKKYGHFLKIYNKDSSSLIYVDKEDNIVLLDYNYLVKKYNVKDSKLVYESNNGKTNFFLILKDNNDKYSVVIDEEIYEITNIFKEFLLLNNDTYINDKITADLLDNNWFKVIGRYGLTYSNFIDTYKDYLKYKNRLDILNQLGLSKEALKYFYARKINSIINTENDDELIEIDDIKKYEIDLYNKLGEEYVKTLKRK